MIITYFRMNAMSIGQFLSIFSNGILHCIINVISYLKAFHTFMLNIPFFFSYYLTNYFNLNIMILSSKLILQFFPCIAWVQQLVLTILINHFNNYQIISNRFSQKNIYFYNKFIYYILYNMGIRVNLYKLHILSFHFSYQSNKIFFYPSTFSLLQPNTNGGNYIFFFKWQF